VGFLDQLKETLQDTGWFVGAPVATAFDMARVPFDDDLTFGKALTTGINRGTQLFLGDNAGTPEDKSDDVENAFSPGVKKTLDGLEWIYDNAIAQPINTGNITQQRVASDVLNAFGVPGAEDDGVSPLDIGSAWKRADEKTGGYAGKGTSIGRESTYMWLSFLGNSMGLSDEGQRQLDEQSKAFDVQSGVVDATARWFIDPTIVLGKASKALKFTAFIRGVKDTKALDKALNEEKAAGGVFSSFGDRLEKANDFNMGVDIGQPRTAAEIYAANPGLQAAGGDGWQIAQSMESASRALHKAGAEPDVIREQGKLISLAGLGDPNALKSLDDNVIEAKDAMAAFRSQRNDLATARDWALHGGTIGREQAANTAKGFVDDVVSRGEDYYQSDEFLNMTNERLKAVTAQFRAAQQEAARTEKLHNLFTGEDTLQGTLSKYPLLASPGFAPLGRVSNTKAMARRAAKETGVPRTPARLDFIFQSSAFNKAVRVGVPISRFAAPHLYYGAKAVRMFNQTQAPRVIEFHDDNAPLALNNFLKHSAVTPETREQLVTDMAAARTEGTKRIVVEKAVTHAQASLIRKYMEEHPNFTEATAQTVIAEQAKQIQREAGRIGVQTRKFTAHKKDDGTPGDVTVDDDGVRYSPLLDTQLENRMVLPDLRVFTKVLDRHSGWLNDMAEWAQGNKAPDQGRVKDLAAKFFQHKIGDNPLKAEKLEQTARNTIDRRWRADQFIDTGLSGMTKFWKGAVLLRPAYPMRVLADSDMRAIAVLGPAAFTQNVMPRAAGFLTLGAASRAKTHFAAQADELRLVKARADLEAYDDMVAAGEQAIPAGAAETAEMLRTQAGEIESRLRQYRLGGRAGRTAAYGRFGEVGQKDIETIMGKIPGAFADDYGKTQRYIASSKTTAGMMGDAQKLALANVMSENWTSLTSADAGHMESWLHAINAQLKQSELGKQALKYQLQNGDDPERAVALLKQWMRNSSAGREIKARMAWDTANSDAHAREIVGYVNHYLPTPELRAKAGEGNISRADLEGGFPDPLDRPPVHGQALARATGRGSTAGKMINDWFNRAMKWLSDAPEDQLARHPMYAAVYEQEARRAAEFIQADPRIQDVSLDQVHTMIQKRAHKKAQQSLKTYMFDVAAQSDLSHALRFYSPFIAAWEDTIRKWSRIASDKPDIVGKGYLTWNAPNDMGLVVDENGNKVESDDFDDKTYMLLQAPSWAPGIGGEPLKIGDTQFRIPKQVVNIILQGGLQPGFGPLVAVPTGALQVANPELDDFAKFINPYGPPESVWDAVAPSTLKRVTEQVNDQSRAHMQDTYRIYMQDLVDYRLDPEKFDGKAPTWESAASKAKTMGLLKIANNFANPFPAIFDSKYKMYQDGYRTLLEQERTEDHPRGWADDKFMEMYGQTFFPLVQSMSKNNSGLGSSAEAVDAAKKYKAEIAKYGIDASGNSDKTLIRLIVGDEGEGAFNQSAHRWQETREISPASGLTFRDYANSQEAAADADAGLGWWRFQKATSTWDAMANQKGLNSYLEDEELVQTRKDFIDQLKAENPAWRQDYESMDPGKFTRNLEQLAEVAQSDKFGVERTDMAGVRQYLVMRQALEQQLQEYGISAGSQDALPFKQQFTEMVMGMVGQNTKFSEWAFHPFLERDPLLVPTTPVPSATTVDAQTQFGIS
jgi:hypothetical protein